MSFVGVPYSRNDSVQWAEPVQVCDHVGCQGKAILVKRRPAAYQCSQEASQGDKGPRYLSYWVQFTMFWSSIAILLFLPFRLGVYACALINQLSVNQLILCIWGGAHVWSSEDNMWDSVLFLHHVGWRDWTQAIRLGSKGLYQLSTSGWACA